MTVELDRGLAALKTEFKAEITSGLITHLGTTNCRRKNNTADGPWSEHAWPNAVDVMLKRIPGTASPTAEAKAVGYRVAKWMRAHPELWSEVFWQVAAHFDHVHGTANPRRNYDNKQVPPCAGGPSDPPPPTGDDDMPLSKDDYAEISRYVWQNSSLMTDPLTGEARGAQHLLRQAVEFSHAASTDGGDSGTGGLTSAEIDAIAVRVADLLAARLKA